MPETEGVLPLKEVHIRQKAKPNGITDVAGSLQYYPINIAAVAATEKGTATFTFPFDVDMISGYLNGVVRDTDKTQSGIDHGDGVCAFTEVGPKVIGTLAGAETTADDVITLNSGQGANVSVGQYVRVTSASTKKWYVVASISGDALTLGENLAEAASSSDNVELAIAGHLASAGSVDDTTITLDTNQGEATGIWEVGQYVQINQESPEKWYQIVSISGDVLTLAEGLDSAVSADDDITMRAFFVGTPDSPEIISPGRTNYEWGLDTLDSSRLPAGVAFKIEFHNSHASDAKSAVGKLAILQ